MELWRTANAGVLLRLDDVTILLDGVCQEVKPYLATPRPLRSMLLREQPDAVVFTHTHADHYDASFVCDYLENTAGPVLGPADIPMSRQDGLTVGKVRIVPVESHHMGKTEPIPHRSYVIQGSKCIWFMGDASPRGWLEMDLPRPDVILAPYGFAIGHGWDITKALSPNAVVLLHLPDRRADVYALWDAVEHAVAGGGHLPVLIPEMGEHIRIL